MEEAQDAHVRHIGWADIMRIRFSVEAAEGEQAPICTPRGYSRAPPQDIAAFEEAAAP